MLSLFLAFVLGAGIGLLLLASGLKKRKDALPFGPFLAVGAFLAMVWGPQFIAWYRLFFGL